MQATNPQGFDRFRSGRGSTRVLFVVAACGRRCLWAMDDYFETGRAQRLLAQARRQSPEFFAIALVHALVVAQSKIADDWCDVFRGPRDTLARYSHGLEMRRSAVDIVLDYTDRYGEDCH